MDFNNWIKKGVPCTFVAAYFNVLPRAAALEAENDTLSLSQHVLRCEREHLRCNSYYQCLVVCDFETLIAFATSRSLSDDPLHRCEHCNF